MYSDTETVVIPPTSCRSPFTVEGVSLGQEEERAATQRETERYDCLWIRGEEEEEEEEGRWNGSVRDFSN